MAQAPPRLWTPAFLAVIVAQAGFGYAYSASLLTPKFLVQALGADASAVGLVTSAFALAAVLAMPATGALADRTGRRPFLTAGAALMTVASLGFATVEVLGPLVYLLRFLQGVAFAMAFVAGAALAVDHAPSERLGQAIGIFGVSMLAMNAVAPAVTEAIAEAAGWPLAFGSASLGSLLCLVLSLRVRERPHPEAGPAPGLWAVARQPRQLRVAAVMLVVGATFGVVMAFHQPFALSLGIERVQGFFFAYAGAGVFVRVGLGRQVDRLGRARVALFALLLYAGTAVGMAWLRPGGLALAGACFGLAHGLFYPAYNAVSVEGAGERERAKVMALFQSWFNAGFGLGTSALGFVADGWGYPLVFAATGGVAFAAAAFLALTPELRGGAGRSEA